MMNDGISDCSCIIDTSGLCEIAAAGDNIKAVLLAELEKGTIGVPAVAWREFASLYKVDALVIAPFIKTKIQAKHVHHVGVARISEKLNSGFSRGPYDERTDHYAAAIAINKRCRVLTSTSQIKEYEHIDCETIDIHSWLSELAEA